MKKSDKKFNRFMFSGVASLVISYFLWHSHYGYACFALGLGVGIILCVSNVVDDPEVTRKEAARARNRLAGTMTISQAHIIFGSYARVLEKTKDDSIAAFNSGNYDLAEQLGSGDLSSCTFSHSTSQIRAALMLGLAEVIRNAKGNKVRANSMREFYVLTKAFSYCPSTIDVQAFTEGCFEIYKATSHGQHSYSGSYWERVYALVPLAFTYLSDDSATVKVTTADLE